MGLRKPLTQMSPEELDALYASKTQPQAQAVQETPDSFAAGSAPWEASGDSFQAGAAPWEIAKGPRIKNVKHPKLSFGDRAVVKNFSTSPEVGLSYLKKKHPEMDFNLDPQGEIIAKDKTEADWSRLDPKGFDLEDISDIGYDVASGVGTGLATIGGAVATGGLGAVGAGAASSAGSEALRQGIGSAMGLEDNISGSDIAISGALGGVSPVLFGSGAGAKDFLKAGLKEAAKQNITGDAAEVFAKEFAKKKAGEFAQKGAVGTAYGVAKTGARKLIGAATEIPDDVLKTMTQNPEVLKRIETEGVESAAAGARDDLLTTISDAKRSAYSDLKTAIDDVGEGINIAPIKEKFKNTIAEFESRGLKNKEALSKLEALKGEFDNLFKGIDGEEIPDILKSSDALDLQGQIAELAEYNKGNGFLSRLAGKDKSVRELGVLADDMYRGLNKTFETATEGKSKQAKDAYAALSKLNKTVLPKFKTEESAFKTLRNLDNKSNAILKNELKKIDEKFGTNLLQKANELKTYSYLGTPEPTSDFAGLLRGVRRTPLMALGGYLGYQGGLASGDPGAAYTGAAIGGALGGGLSNPYMVRKGLEGLMKGERAILNPAVQRFGAPSAWQMMNLQRRKNENRN